MKYDLSLTMYIYNFAQPCKYVNHLFTHFFLLIITKPFTSQGLGFSTVCQHFLPDLVTRS
jgi:hypothetical protein